MQEFRVAVIGSGPAGYTAGLYTSRAQLSPLVLAGIKSGGQLMWTTDIENFPGFPEGIGGAELMMKMRDQTTKFGAVVKDEFATAIDFSSRPFKIWNNFPEDETVEVYEQGTQEQIDTLKAKIMEAEPAYTAQAVILAMGAVSIMLGIPGEKEFLGKGVSTCAVCDAAFYREKETFVVGGGDSAMEDALALTKFAKKVTVIHRRQEFKASKIMQERVLNNPKVEVLWNTVTKEVKGDKTVTSIVVETSKDGQTETKELKADGFFVAIGHKPMSHLVHNQVQLDTHGYIVTRQSATNHGLQMAGAALDEAGLVQYPSMTSVEGVFAAGDIVDVRYKQAITAAGQGCSAALDAERWLERQ